MSMIISYIGVFVFIGLTAYDTQKLKDMARSQPDGLDNAVIRKGAISGALSLASQNIRRKQGIEKYIKKTGLWIYFLREQQEGGAERLNSPFIVLAP